MGGRDCEVDWYRLSADVKLIGYVPFSLSDPASTKEWQLHRRTRCTSRMTIETGVVWPPHGRKNDQQTTKLNVDDLLIDAEIEKACAASFTQLRNQATTPEQNVQRTEQDSGQISTKHDITSHRHTLQVPTRSCPTHDAVIPFSNTNVQPLI